MIMHALIWAMDLSLSSVATLTDPVLTRLLDANTKVQPCWLIPLLLMNLDLQLVPQYLLVSTAVKSSCLVVKRTTTAS